MSNELNNENSIDAECVSTILRYSKEYGLETEVVLLALYAMKTNPLMSIREAMLYGFNEWIK